MFTEKNLSEDCLPSTLDALVIHLRKALIFSLNSFTSFIKNVKYNIEKTISLHKIPIYIKSFFLNRVYNHLYINDLYINCILIYT